MKNMSISEMLSETEDDIKWALRHSPSCENLKENVLKEIINLLESMRKVRKMCGD